MIRRGNAALACGRDFFCGFDVQLDEVRGSLREEGVVSVRKYGGYHLELS